MLCQRDKDGNTPFHLAAASGDMDTLDNFVRFLDQQTFGTRVRGTRVGRHISGVNLIFECGIFLGHTVAVRGTKR